MPFAGNPLDRAQNLRRDAAWLEAQLESPSSRFLPYWRLNALVHASDAPGLLWLDAGVRDLVRDVEPVFLGVRDGVSHFAIDLSSVEEPVNALGLTDARFADVRSLATQVAIEDAGILAHGRSSVDWHNRHRFCGVCGSPTVARDGGGSRKCERCDASHFPRTDPVVIMVVWREDRCVLGSRLGRQNTYSCLAGYIDQGETIEEAVRREVEEEVGLPVDDVVYHASQPWPFPSTLMIGCFAHTTGEELHVDPVEIGEARWFTRDEVRRAIFEPDASLGFSVPGRVAIAHHLLKAWATGETSH